jgi:selenium metabolism protein YedF
MKTDNDLLLIVKSSAIGEGEVDLGEKLAVSFFDVLSRAETVPARMLFINSGIFLTTEGSPVIDSLRKLDDEGTQILSCKTCLDYHGRSDKLLVGKPTNMKETVDAMLTFKRVIAL